MKKFLQIMIGIALLVGGLVLVFLWWPSVVAVFKGVIGGLLAVLGLIIIYLSTPKK